MKQARAILFAGNGKILWTYCIHLVSCFLIGLAPIDIGHGCAVEDKCGCVQGKERQNCIKVSNIQFIDINRNYLALGIKKGKSTQAGCSFPKYFCQFVAKLPLGPVISIVM